MVCNYSPISYEKKGSITQWRTFIQFEYWAENQSTIHE